MCFVWSSKELSTQRCGSKGSWAAIQVVGLLCWKGEKIVTAQVGWDLRDEFFETIPVIEVLVAARGNNACQIHRCPWVFVLELVLNSSSCAN